MTTHMKRAIDVLDMLSMADLKSADDDALRKFRDLAHHWHELATRALADRQPRRQDKS